MLKKLFSHERETTSKDIIVVSGLPRSGTSMMMKMLVEGGLEAVTDSLRAADDDNPDGYFEFEPVKQLTDGNSRWLENAGGKVVKVISALLEHLPATYHYKVIFMERPLEEILASQKKMLTNRGEIAGTSDAQIKEQFNKHLGAIKYWLVRQSHMEVLYIDYADMLESPVSYSGVVADFLKIRVDVEKMQAVPNQKLYRNRAR